MNDNQTHIPGNRPEAKPDSEDSGAELDCREGLKRQAREVVFQTPEVRPEKVARLKEAIEQGAYEIDTEKLADIIIEELVPKR